MSADDGPLSNNDELARADARALFDAALQEPAYSGKVYYLVGSGGIGKSHELGWIHARAQALRAGRVATADPRLARDLIETGIIDLAHTSYQQPILLMATLARRITRSLSGKARTHGYFTTFFDEAERYLKRGGEGTGGKGIEQVRTRFLEDYRIATNGKRLLITLDTFERLDPRIPEVERYNFRKVGRLETWLVELLAALPNSLTVIAGRARERQLQSLRQLLGPRLVRRVALPPLSPAETREFVAENGLPDEDRGLDWYELMYTISGGLPVRLIVALQIARACGFDPDHLPPSLRDPDQGDTAQLGQDFVDDFVGSLHRTNPQLAQLIAQACYLRKGLYVDLLAFIDNADPAYIEGLLAQMAGFGFVKVSGDGILTLHDDVYDLLDDRLTPGSVDRWQAAAIDFLNQEQSRLRKTIASEGMSIDRLARLRMLQIDRLYYQLAREPVLQGYQNYCELVYGAIFTRDSDFDAQLQDELARFFDPQSQSGRRARQRFAIDDMPWERICYDEAVRWVFRRTHSPEYNGVRRAILDLADQIGHDYRALIAADPLARCALETMALEALGFHTDEGALDQLLADYASLAARLAAIERAEEGGRRAIHRYRHQQSRFLRAYALNNWGYQARRLLRLDTAIGRYADAVAIYKTLGDETNVMQATSLNNLGFAYNLQGDIELALICVDEALSLQHQAGARYREAASYQTKANLALSLDDMYGAEQSIARSQALLQDFPDTRNAALSALHQGNTARWKAFRDRDDPARSAAHLDAALRAYGEFQHYFERQSGESERRFEALQGLGCTHRRRGHLLSRRGEDGSADMERARELFHEALGLTSPGHSQRRADILEDLALAYTFEERYTEALDTLDRAAEAIPAAFDVRPGAGTIETLDTREQKGFWLHRSKVEQQRGICYLGLDDGERACAALLKAFACLRRFSPRAQQLRTYRIVAQEKLLERYRQRADGPDELAALRRRTYMTSQHLGTREAFFEIEYVFEIVEQMLKLL